MTPSSQCPWISLFPPLLTHELLNTIVSLSASTADEPPFRHLPLLDEIQKGINDSFSLSQHPHGKLPRPEPAPHKNLASFTAWNGRRRLFLWP
jgi:hypothetical protein